MINNSHNIDTCITKLVSLAVYVDSLEKQELPDEG